eukprot:s470_g2.t1
MQAKLDDTEFLAEQMRLLHGQLQMLWQNFEKLIAGEKDSRRGFERTEKAFSRAVRTGTSPAGVKRRNLAYATPCQMCELRQESGHQGHGTVGSGSCFLADTVAKPCSPRACFLCSACPGTTGSAVTQQARLPASFAVMTLQILPVSAPQRYSVIYRLILARLRCLRPWLLAETDFGVLVHLVKNAHLDFIGPDCRPWPRPARPGLPGFAVDESSPKLGEGVSRSAHTDGTAVTAGPQPMMSRRRGLLRRLVRARDPQTVSANRCPQLPQCCTGAYLQVGRRIGGSSRHADSDGSEDAADGLPDNSRPVCESCENGGGEQQPWGSHVSYAVFQKRLLSGAISAA